MGILFNRDFFDTVVLGIFAAVPIMWLVERFVKAPMGKFARAGWGPMVDYRVAWLIMELPATLGFIWLFMQGQRRGDVVPLIFLVFWLLHYLDRHFVYPFRVRGGKPFSLLVALSGFFYQAVNGYANAFWIGHFGQYDITWLSDPRFSIGAVVFFAGLYINRQSDAILRNLRRPGESGYKIPVGGFFRYVSCPHYFGEIVMWLGWAIATWSWAGLSFAVFTGFNIGTRAFNAHRWYLEKFPDYPKERKALFPYLI